MLNLFLQSVGVFYLWLPEHQQWFMIVAYLYSIAILLYADYNICADESDRRTITLVAFCLTILFFKYVIKIL